MRITIKLKSLNDVEFLLNKLKPLNSYIDRFDENSFEYEDLCEKVTEYFCEIEEFLIGKEPYNNESLANADIRMMCYWDYLKGKYDFKLLLKKLRKYSKTRNYEF